jgi:hypothetical protein
LSELSQRIFSLGKDKIDLFIIVVLIISSIVFLSFSVIYLYTDKPLASLLAFVIGIILLSSGLGVYRSYKSSV